MPTRSCVQLTPAHLRSAQTLSYGHINTWDVTRVTNFNHLFMEAAANQFNDYIVTRVPRTLVFLRATACPLKEACRVSLCCFHVRRVAHRVIGTSRESRTWAECSTKPTPSTSHSVSGIRRASPSCHKSSNLHAPSIRCAVITRSDAASHVFFCVDLVVGALIDIARPCAGPECMERLQSRHLR
jgi:hypothetical protein